MHRSDGATTLLGMPGFVVGAQVEVDGELWLHVETTTDVAGCAGCGTRALGHGRRRAKVRDLPMAGRPVVVVVWAKRIWRCPDPDCEVGTWTEESDAIWPRAALTDRARAEICRRVGEDEDSVCLRQRALVRRSVVVVGGTGSSVAGRRLSAAKEEGGGRDVAASRCRWCPAGTDPVPS